MRPLPLGPDLIVELVLDALEGAAVGFSMGVQGALAEFAVPGGDRAAVDVRRSGRTVEASTAGGGLRLTITDETRVFGPEGSDHADRISTLYLAVPRRSLAAPAVGVTITETDAGALRPEDARDLLVDLAVGHAVAAFSVRTADPDLGKQLRAIEGTTWEDALQAEGPALVAASPHRIVATPLGRIEVYTPIPTEDAASPEGPHTHLLPALLRTGRELPHGIDLPPHLAPAAAFHPPSGWAPPFQ